ncbi:MAG: penicillin-binding protein 2 [Anaerolineae bacterium]
MRHAPLALLTLLTLLFGCSIPQTTPTPTATATPRPPTPTPDLVGPEVVGRAFLDAWSRDDYAKMYDYLAPSLRAGLSRERFEQAYRTALETTTTLTVTTIPQELLVDGSQAHMIFLERWETALFGTLETQNRLELTLEAQQWGVNWERAAIWPELAGGNTFVVEYRVPPRANIYDKEGAGLAVPSTIVTVGVIPGQIQDETTLLAGLSEALGMSAEEIRAAYAGQPDNWFIPIADISGEESQQHAALLAQPGIELRERAGRLYPLDGVGAHVVGWVAPIPAESADIYRQRGYRADARVGVAGLEAWGEALLAGKNGGRLYLVDPEGHYVHSVADVEPERGRSLTTTLDRTLQKHVEEILGTRRGAVVALDVNTGAVRAMASGPGFDNNIFVRPTDEVERRSVLTHPDRPLLNRAIQETYPCGSVFKIVTMATALESEHATAQTRFFCPGYWDGLGSANRKTCWLESGHGDLNLKEGLIGSCNVVFYEVGKRLHEADPELLPTYGAAFGLGQRTGLPELYEAAGLMPDPQWKEETYFEGWATGDSVNLAIGQGFIQVTPLQVARMIAAIANGGTLYRPYLVSKIAANNFHPEETIAPVAVGQLPLSADHLATIQEAMLGVTTQPLGTASHRFQGLSIPVAGKTGTAQAPGEEALPHAWFAGYFPADAPEIALVVLVENAGEGSAIAAPLFRQIVEAYYGLPLTPLPEEPGPSSEPTPTAAP